MDDPGLPPEVDRFRDCGPVVRASFARQQLDVSLFDYARYTERYLKSYELLRDGFAGAGDVKVAQRILGLAGSSAPVQKLKELSAEEAMQRVADWHAAVVRIGGGEKPELLDTSPPDFPESRSRILKVLNSYFPDRFLPINSVARKGLTMLSQPLFILRLW